MRPSAPPWLGIVRDLRWRELGMAGFRQSHSGSNMHDRPTRPRVGDVEFVQTGFRDSLLQSVGVSQDVHDFLAVAA